MLFHGRKSVHFTPLSVALNDARRLVGIYVHHYNYIRLHSAIGYIAPIAKLEGRETAIFAERNHKLEASRTLRKEQRKQSVDY